MIGGLTYIRKASGQRSVDLTNVAGPEAIRRLRAIADRMEPRVRRAFEQAINSIRDEISEAEIAALIERGDIDGIMARITPQLLEDNFQVVAAAISQAVLAGGEVAAALQPAVIGVNGQTVNFVFNATNPRLASFAQRATAQRIREISEDVRGVMRGVIQRGTLVGDNPRTTARAVRESLGLTAKQELAVRNYRAALETNSSSALQRALRDRRFDPTVRRAIEQGVQLSDDQINRMVERYRARYVKYRSEVIARTESIRAVQGAQHELFQSYIDDGRIAPQQVRRFWHYTQDERTRAEHGTLRLPSERELRQDARCEPSRAAAATSDGLRSGSGTAVPSVSRPLVRAGRKNRWRT